MKLFAFFKLNTIIKSIKDYRNIVFPYFYFVLANAGSEAEQNIYIQYIHTTAFLSRGLRSWIGNFCCLIPFSWSCSSRKMCVLFFESFCGWHNFYTTAALFIVFLRKMGFLKKGIIFSLCCQKMAKFLFPEGSENSSASLLCIWGDFHVQCGLNLTFMQDPF